MDNELQEMVLEAVNKLNSDWRHHESEAEKTPLEDVMTPFTAVIGEQYQHINFLGSLHVWGDDEEAETVEEIVASVTDYLGFINFQLYNFLEGSGYYEETPKVAGNSN